MTPLLSVIVPAYNAALWVEHTLQSIFHARMPYPGALEVIVVDDGSTDATPSILDTLLANKTDTKEQTSLSVIHQANQGLSGARNSGIEAAHGRYIAFVDADDAWCDDISLPWEEMERGEVEILGLDMLCVDPNGKSKPYRRYKPTYNRLFSPASTFLQGRNLFPCAVSYIVSSDLLKRSGIRFTPGIYHEDEEFAVQIFLAARSFKAIQGPHYLYIKRKGSITTASDVEKNRKRVNDLLGILKRLDNLRITPQQDKNSSSNVLDTKIQYLTIDVLRILLSTTQDKEYLKSVVSELRQSGLYPLPFCTDLHYLALRLYIQVKLLK